MRQETSKKNQFHMTLVVSIVTAAAIALLTYFFLTVQIVVGSSMTPTLNTGDVLLTVRGLEVERGDVIAFYHGNNVLVRRCIGLPGDQIRIDDGGKVFVNGEQLQEPYVLQSVSDGGDLEYPYQVPAGRYFVLGDNRETAPDSRTAVVGSISTDQLVGEVLFRIWPVKAMTFLPGSSHEK